jgi:hypothetical protein
VLVEWWRRKIDWFVHRDMTKRWTESWARGAFEDFLYQYKKHNWTRNEKFPKSHFDHLSNSEIHASIIKFDNVGMLLDYFSFLKFAKWQRKNRLLPKEILAKEINYKWR